MLKKFLIWKTIKIGTGPKTAGDFTKAIKKKKMIIDKFGADILNRSKLTTAKREKEIDLVMLTLAQLGFKNGAELNKIYAKAKKLGLKLCPPEVGPQLRLQYIDQPKGEWVVFGMKPIRDSEGNLCVFGVGCDDFEQLWLGGFFNPEPIWKAGSRWAFVYPRK